MPSSHDVTSFFVVARRTTLLPSSSSSSSSLRYLVLSPPGTVWYRPCPLLRCDRVLRRLGLCLRRFRTAIWRRRRVPRSGGPVLCAVVPLYDLSLMVFVRADDQYGIRGLSRQVSEGLPGPSWAHKSQATPSFAGTPRPVQV